MRSIGVMTAMLGFMLFGSPICAATLATDPEAEKQQTPDGSNGAVYVAGQRVQENEIQKSKAQLKEEAQRRLTEYKKNSLREQNLRRQTIADLKEKWSKVESGWKDECARHDGVKQEIEKMPQGPERTARLEAENAAHRTKSKELALERNVVHEGVIKQANRDVAGGTSNVSSEIKQTAGTKITDPNHRAMNGDLDGGGGLRTTEKAGKILNEIGVKGANGGPVKVQNGVLETAPEFGMTVNANVGTDRVGSAGHQAQVQTGAQHGETYISETGGAVKSQALKDHLATLDHSKKAMHGLNEDPGALVGGSPEGQAMAKGAVKAADQAGLPPEQIDAIAKKHGIENPKELMEHLAEIKTGRSTIANAQEAAKLQGATKDILDAAQTTTKAKAQTAIEETKMKALELEANGKVQEAAKLREEVADYNAKSKASSEALSEPDKTPSKTAEGPGKENTVTTEKPKTEPEMKGRTGIEPEPVSTVRKAPMEPGVLAEAPPKMSGLTPEPSVKPEVTTRGEPTTAGKAIGVAGIALGAYGIYEGYNKASEEMAAKKRGEPKGAIAWTGDKIELAGRTLWHGLGFTQAAEAGEAAGRESLAQYKKDIKDGKVSADSMASYGWMKTRAVLGGLYGFGKALTFDAAKSSGTMLGEAIGQGVGVGADSYGWLKGLVTEGMTRRAQSKEIYNTLIKKGASTIGAQDAADRVLKGDFTEAKRLNRVLEGKIKKKEIAAQEAKGKTSQREPDIQVPPSREGGSPWQTMMNSLHNIKDSITQLGDTIKEKYNKYLAEKVKAEKAEKAKSQKTKPAGSIIDSLLGLGKSATSALAGLFKGSAVKGAADKLAGPALQPGTHEEISGWAENKNGKTSLTYIKDANGNVLGGYYTHYDSKGNVIGREAFKNKPAVSDEKPKVANAEEVWTGKFRLAKSTNEKDWERFAMTFHADGTVTLDGPQNHIKWACDLALSLGKCMAEAFGDVYTYSLNYEVHNKVSCSRSGNSIATPNSLYTVVSETINSRKKGNSSKKYSYYLALNGSINGNTASGTFNTRRDAYNDSYVWQATKR